jgi:hypothetical protein
MKVGRQTFAVLDNQIASQVDAAHGFPIAIFLACYSGAFDRKKDCLGEVLVCQPKGPIACLCGSRMTMPYGMATLSYQVMNEFFEHDHETLGEVILCAKQKLAANELEGEHRQMIEGLGQSFSPRTELLALERHEHLQMFHLLGDPLLRVRRPQPLELQVELSTDDRRSARVTVDAPSSGELLLDVCYKRDRLRFRPERRKSFDVSPASLIAFEETYRKSNDLTCCSQTYHIEAGSFSAELPIPADANGECHVRAYLTSGRQAWAQAIPVRLR